MSYYSPKKADEALEILNDVQPKIVAGCTDYFPARAHWAKDVALLDVTKIDEFRGLSESDKGWRLGAATSWSDIVKAPLPNAFDGLKLAAREVGSVQIQNRGTVAGNICNASPAADGVPPLLVLDAQVEIISTAGPRIVPLKDFILGVRKIDLKSNELVSAILIPKISKNARSAFLKLGSRTHLVISIAMVAVVLEMAEGVVVDARIAVGSCSPVAERLPDLESSLLGKGAAEIKQLALDDKTLWAPLKPISDVRGSGDYRLDVVVPMCKRAVLEACADV